MVHALSPAVAPGTRRSDSSAVALAHTRAMPGRPDLKDGGWGGCRAGVSGLELSDDAQPNLSRMSPARNDLLRRASRARAPRVCGAGVFFLRTSGPEKMGRPPVTSRLWGVDRMRASRKGCRRLDGLLADTTLLRTHTGGTCVLRRGRKTAGDWLIGYQAKWREASKLNARTLFQRTVEMQQQAEGK